MSSSSSVPASEATNPAPEPSVGAATTAAAAEVVDGVESNREALLRAATAAGVDGMDLDVPDVDLGSDLGIIAAIEDSNISFSSQSSDTSSQSSSISSSTNVGIKSAVPPASSSPSGGGGGAPPPMRLSKTQYAAFAGVREQRIIRACDVREELRPLFLEQRPSLPQETADRAATLVQLQKESKRAAARADAAAVASGGSGSGGGSASASSSEGKHKTNWKNRNGSFSADGSSSTSAAGAGSGGSAAGAASSSSSTSSASSSSNYYKLARLAKQAAADLAIAESERGMADTPWRNCRLGALTILSLGDLAPSLAACARLDAQHFRLASKKSATKSAGENGSSGSDDTGSSTGASAMRDEAGNGSSAHSTENSQRTSNDGKEGKEEVVPGLPYFHTEDHLFPRDFKSSRPYWSAAQPLKRTLYVNEVFSLSLTLFAPCVCVNGCIF